MKPYRPSAWYICPIVMGSLWVTDAVGSAPGRVELELVTQDRVSVTAQQDWLRRLAQVGVSNLRIQSGRSSQVGIEVRGTKQAPTYVVTGIITAGGEVLLPGGRFKPTDAGQLARWLDDLARLGPPDQRPQISAFGLTTDRLEKVLEELARPVALSTAGKGRKEVVRTISRRLTTSVRIDPQLIPAFRDDDLVAEELSGLSCGTALAYTVRPLGVCLAPRESTGGQVEYVLTESGPNVEAWPVGWEPEKPRREVLPGLFEFLNVNVQGVPVTKVLEAVHARLDIPVLLDYNAMARYGVEPENSLVSLPQARTTYSLLLRKTLSQAKLQNELRLDEAGKPFLWVTTTKPL